MTMTTIKVDTVVRDQLAKAASARGTTMTALLRDIASELESQMRWSIIEASYDRLQREDPASWTEYTSELASWDVVGASPGDAAAEWPEYNR